VKNFANKILFAIILVFSFTAAEKTIILPPPCCKALSADAESHVCPDRVFALFLPQVIPLKSLLLTIEHRGSSPAFDHPFRDFLGLDNGGLKIGLGLRYSPLEHLDVGFRRANNVYELWDTYEFDGRYQFLEETAQVVDAAVITGFTWFYQYNAPDASGLYLCGIFGKSFLDQFYASTGIMVHSYSTYMYKDSTADASSIAIPLSFTFSTQVGLSLNGEMFIPAAGYSAGKAGYAAGVKYATWHHSFSLLFSNTPYTTFDGVVTGSHKWDKPILAFLITRRFGGRD